MPVASADKKGLMDSNIYISVSKSLSANKEKTIELDVSKIGEFGTYPVIIVYSELNGILSFCFLNVETAFNELKCTAIGKDSMERINIYFDSISKKVYLSNENTENTAFFNISGINVKYIDKISIEGLTHVTIRTI